MQIAERPFWEGRRVFLTGHTGFKGSWLSLLLTHLGAEVTGFALEPPSGGLFELSGAEHGMHSLTGDVEDSAALDDALKKARPEVVFHLAAQSQVRESIENPVATYRTNVIGTANLLEAVRHCGGVKAVVVVTSDKSYFNLEQARAYRENDRLGGSDPYSGSKACEELVAETFRLSYFPEADFARHGTAIATARSSNVIGGGDVCYSRLLPGIIRAALAGEAMSIRSPGALRPWQHVLDSLNGYLLLAQRLFTDGPSFCGGWNFGPCEEDIRSVREIAEMLCGLVEGARCVVNDSGTMREAVILKIDSTKAHELLGWSPVWRIEAAIAKTLEFYKRQFAGENVGALCRSQIDRFIEDAHRADANE